MASVEVLDVGHGVCVALQTDDGKLWLFDCGHDDALRPSVRFAGRTLHRLFVSNYDHDHISDLPGIAANVRILTRNASITAEQLRTLKRQSGPIGDAMETLLGMISGTHTSAAALHELAPPNVRTELFYNPYFTTALPDHGYFNDTNNISLVTFLHVHGLHMVLPGDLEKAGWTALLRDARFRQELASVNVFMASHHGRESGYCEDVFNYCKPQLIVISDCEKKHETQEMTDTYASKASGCVIDGVERKVLTTRKDGTIRFTASASSTTVERDVAAAAFRALARLGAGRTQF